MDVVEVVVGVVVDVVEDVLEENEDVVDDDDDVLVSSMMGAIEDLGEATLAFLRGGSLLQLFAIRAANTDSDPLAESCSLLELYVANICLLKNFASNCSVDKELIPITESKAATKSDDDSTLSMDAMVSSLPSTKSCKPR